MPSVIITRQETFIFKANFWRVGERGARNSEKMIREGESKWLLWTNWLRFRLHNRIDPVWARMKDDMYDDNIVKHSWPRTKGLTEDAILESWHKLLSVRESSIQMRRTLDEHSFVLTVNDGRSVAYLAILGSKQSHVSKCKRHVSDLRSDPPEEALARWVRFDFTSTTYDPVFFKYSFPELLRTLIVGVTNKKWRNGCSDKKWRNECSDS